jgi:hypothetical protein
MWLESIQQERILELVYPSRKEPYKRENRSHSLFLAIIVTMAVILFLVYCIYNNKLKIQATFNNNNHNIA